MAGGTTIVDRLNKLSGKDATTIAKALENLEEGGGIGGFEIHICASGEYDAETKVPTIEEPDSSTLYLVPTSEKSGDLFDEFIWTGEEWERFGAGSVNIQNPDWEESDPTSAAYIKNRPFYIEANFSTVYEGDLDFTSTGDGMWYTNGATMSGSIPLDANVLISIDGIKLEGAVQYADGTYYIGAKNPGDRSNIKEHGIGVTFVRTSEYGLGGIGYIMIDSDLRQSGRYHFSLKEGQSIIHEIDPKFYGGKLNIVNGTGYKAIAEGNATTASGYASHAEGNNTKALEDESHAEGRSTTASGDESHAEGQNTTASGRYSHAEGYGTKAENDASHAEGYGAKASGQYSHAEGRDTTASGQYSHAEGYGTKATESNSHAEGRSTTASGQYSHAEGYGTTVSGSSSHAEGNNTTASGGESHAEGRDTTASGQYSHAEGYGTKASSACQHVFGEANIEDKASSMFLRSTYVEIVGNGSMTTGVKSNARTLDWSGNEWLAGSITLGETTLTENNLKALLALLNA